MRPRPLLVAVCLLFLNAFTGPLMASQGGAEEGFGHELSLLWVAPFAVLLLAIAVLPLAAPPYWEHNRNKGIVAGIIALPVFAFLVANHPQALLHTAHEYASFILLLGALFVISGGILVTGDIRATPATNTVILALGGLLANLIGTTGASMLLIRPLLRINSERRRTLHSVIFFIFVVSNVGGCLTPLGDPPLFLGFLRGVPFFWTLRLWVEWAFMVGALLAIYWVFDTREYRKERPEDLRQDVLRIEPMKVVGWVNLMFLLGVLASVLFLKSSPWREIGMLAMAAGSLWMTAKPMREANGFTFGPIVEVAVLFAGIFVAMVPALEILKARGGELGISESWQFFVMTGSLSSFLDNAPTYLTFVSLAQGLHAAGGAGNALVHMTGGPVPEHLLASISLGAVFMGANTYIGNGPNFMVKVIAESSGIRMPSFFGYMVWSGLILGPLFFVVARFFV